MNPMVGTLLACCPRAASGHAVAEPTIPLMKSRRRIAAPKAQACADYALECDYSRDLRLAEWGAPVILRGNNPQDRMSALGQKQTLQGILLMSALPPKADITARDWYVRFVPIADIKAIHQERSGGPR